MCYPVCPCKGCRIRAVGCHGQCEGYKEYRAQLDAWNVENRSYWTERESFKKYKPNEKKLSTWRA